MTAIILVFLLSTATVIQGESLRRVKRIIGKRFGGKENLEHT